jgi:1,4-dihydroxy-2-naphthoyl-CoA synthase
MSQYFMNETFETIVCSQPADHVLLITLDRPDVGNALNTKMGEELRDLFVHYTTHSTAVLCADHRRQRKDFLRRGRPQTTQWHEQRGMARAAPRF